MEFIYGKNDWKTMERGQENCYLITNGLGGYSSLTMIGSNTRNDHALLMACTTAPNHRYHLITKLEESILLETGTKVELSSQEYVNYAKNQMGFLYLNQFMFEYYPIWIYQAEGVEMKKQTVMAYGENTIGIRYEITNSRKSQVKLIITPQLQFVPKGETLNKKQSFELKQDTIISNKIKIYYTANGELSVYDTEYIDDLYYGYDARDDRASIGVTAHNHNISIQVKGFEKKKLDIIYSTQKNNHTLDGLIIEEIKRQSRLVEQSGIKDATGRQLVKSADQYIVDRKSTKGKTLMAGYPFFTDWGRDTMISVVGCCIVTKRYKEAKSIFGTFLEHCQNGLMPNVFSEGESVPLYNTVDASLLFIGAVYEYYQASNDLDFVKEAYAAMEDIIKWYQQGTKYHIKMDTDGLIMAGSGLEQVTWMDVCFGDILPTPRHGKPVEVNAYWYNDLKIMGYFARLLGKRDIQYEELAKLVKVSFCEKFWNESEDCLKDFISGKAKDKQIRCNQIWAVSQPFSLLDPKKEKMVVHKVYETLYTPYGLRSLNKNDKDYKPFYGGTHFNRDMAYHQGTVWAFPLGAYYLAYLKVNDYKREAVSKVKEQLCALKACMREGCIGQIAEIYDGETPSVSRGCFAQAWSVGELLRVYAKLENLENLK
ncbi:amylo-alpha-1,6-glucosidase [Lachnotalea glycerini]|uniref:Glycogen debranching protein n=1 Tax=Lachnotalea glycerini TaxID=1763509 RepID=A0A371JG15_9FIRM|nr:amylo-alpha-1,6-glucosidase [Lachnotalea glycerini]RDY31616.1 glycogen debranching protein [Lachnotalea glycerini]